MWQSNSVYERPREIQESLPHIYLFYFFLCLCSHVITRTKLSVRGIPLRRKQDSGCSRTGSLIYRFYLLNSRRRRRKKPHNQHRYRSSSHEDIIFVGRRPSLPPPHLSSHPICRLPECHSSLSVCARPRWGKQKQVRRKFALCPLHLSQSTSATSRAKFPPNPQEDRRASASNAY